MAVDWLRLKPLLEETLCLDTDRRSQLVAQTEREGPELAGELRTLLAAEPPAVLDHTVSSIIHLPPGVRLGPWRLGGLLGSGGMGAVYQGERADGAFVLDVAIKILKPGMDTEGLLRCFARERRILARLSHRSIARLLDGGATPSGRPYLVDEEDGA